MQQRSFIAENYRFGYSSQEQENNISGKNCLSFEFRLYDSRLGRFYSVDPVSKRYPWNSVYCYAENKVINGIDLEGAEYLNANESRIEFKYGKILRKIKNFTPPSRSAYYNTHNND